MGIYTSKYTGEQIDNLLGQVENGRTKLKVFLSKRLENIKASTSFDMDIVANEGFDITENNKVLLNAGKTYQFDVQVMSTNGSSSSSSQIGVLTNIPDFPQVALYSSNMNNQYGVSGFMRGVVTITEDIELTFTTDSYTSNVGVARVACRIEEW